MFGTDRLPSGNAGVPDLSSLRSRATSLRSNLTSLSSGVASFRSNLSYYDVALVVLPIPILVGFLAGELLSLTPGVGTSVGAAVSALAVGYLLFGNPPIRRGPQTNRGSRTNREQEGIDGPSV